jgi:hypothetical protein
MAMSAPSFPSAELMPGFQYYLPYETSDNPVVIGILSFFSFIILYNTLVPISLYVSVELIRLVLDIVRHCFAAWQIIMKGVSFESSKRGVPYGWSVPYFGDK